MAEPQATDGNVSDGKSTPAPDSPEKKDQPASDDTGNKTATPKEEDKPRKPPSKKPLIIIGLVVLVLAVLGLWYWFAHRNEQSTDDAYTDGNVVMVAPKVAGYVVDLRVSDNGFVHQGDIVVRIDARDARAALDQAVAGLALAEAQEASAHAQLAVARVQYPAQLAQAQAQQSSASAQLTQAAASYARQHDVDVRATTLENIDAADSQHTSAQANVENARAQVRIANQVSEQITQITALVTERSAGVRSAQAQLDQAKLNLSYCEIRAPADGWVTRRSVQLGSYLQPGEALFALVTTDVWVTANFKESQLTRIRAGNAVKISIDAYPNLALSGHIDSIQQGSGSRFSAFPAENATGNFVKIVQRVPVKIVIDHGLDRERRLPLGLSVSPVVTLP